VLGRGLLAEQGAGLQRVGRCLRGPHQQGLAGGGEQPAEGVEVHPPIMADADLGPALALPGVEC
jgi:hypothetical protein